MLDQAEHAPDQLLSRGPRLTFDEVQRAPQLLLGIKRIVDAERVPGQFLLTGSANLELLQGVSETLAGRAVYVMLAPMTASELLGGGSTGRWDAFLNHPASEWAAILPSRPAPDAAAWTPISPCAEAIRSRH